MNPVQAHSDIPLSSILRAKQQLKDKASQEANRAQELKRSGVDDLFTSQERLNEAQEYKDEAASLKQESQRLARSGSAQKDRGLARLEQGSTKLSQGQEQEEQGLEELQHSLDDLKQASGDKEQGLSLAKDGLGQQATENLRQGESLVKFKQVNAESQELTEFKDVKLQAMQENLQQREQSLENQTSSLDSYLVAGDEFGQARGIKKSGYDTLQKASAHSVKAEGHQDASETQALKQNWAELDQKRNEDTSLDLKLSSIYQSLKAKAQKLEASYYQEDATKNLSAADRLDFEATELKAKADTARNQARCLERSGQCHIAIGRQMQCCPWTYCQGVQLERQGQAEVQEAQRLKVQAKDMRSSAQEKSLAAAELRAIGEDSQARFEGLEVESQGSSARASLLATRSDEHSDQADKEKEIAEQAAHEAGRYQSLAQKEGRKADRLQKKGASKLEQGLQAGQTALAQQGKAGSALASELQSESKLTESSQELASSTKATVASQLGVLGRGASLLYQIGKSQQQEGKAQDKIGAGLEQLRDGLERSQQAQDKGVEAARLIEEAKSLELEGLRLQNRGQKMLLAAEPKLAESAKLSSQSFSASSTAQRLEDEAAHFIELGGQKLKAAEVIREKAARLNELAT